MDLGLKQKVAILTGGSRGIGKGIALALAQEGCHLAICARNAESLQQAAKEMRAHQVKVLPLALDVTQPDQAQQLVEQTAAQFGRIDILINNVGGNRRGEFETTTDQDWGGAIIFISSIFGRESGGRGLAIYNTTKSAMISLAKIMAVELAPHKIRVNSVAPGSIRFPGGSWDKRCLQDPEGMAEFVKREMPLGRFGTVEEVANVVAFLASERASLLTGACVNVDGGQSRSLI
ncbi:short-chain dehydrogenase [candidate division KSB1 bacterium]|nr:MAG: short-chain dehydrogenase [candidate division KSB1 bacterium]